MIRQTASAEASEIGEHGENALDRLAYQGEITLSRRFAETLLSCETGYEGGMFRRSQPLLKNFADSCAIAPKKCGGIEP
jgi:hypothetical protein